MIQQFGTDITALPQKTIGDCFEAINNHDVNYAIVPFENSTNGQVVFTYDLLRDWYLSPTTSSSPPPSFKIVGEQYVSIHHNFLTNAKSIDDITTIYSHPQVWTQVTKFLAGIKKNIVKIDVGSTSKAAEMVSQDKTNSTAAISSKMSAVLYGLPMMHESIEDNVTNTTRFLVLGYDYPPSPPPPSKEDNPDQIDQEEGTMITSLMFTIDNESNPGSLCDVLLKFKTHGINLTSITSRPAGNLNQPWTYVFFVELLGPLKNEDKVWVDELGIQGLKVVVLGSFKRSWRYEASLRKPTIRE